MKEPREVLTMIPNEKGFDLSNTEATGVWFQYIRSRVVTTEKIEKKRQLAFRKSKITNELSYKTASVTKKANVEESNYKTVNVTKKLNKSSKNDYMNKWAYTYMLSGFRWWHTILKHAIYSLKSRAFNNPVSGRRAGHLDR